jgi:hypothetical protein
VLLVVAGVVLMGLAAGFAAASFKARRIRRALATAGYLPDERADAAFRRRLVICGLVGLAGVVLTVTGAIWMS